MAGKGHEGSFDGPKHPSRTHQDRFVCTGHLGTNLAVFPVHVYVLGRRANNSHTPVGELVLSGLADTDDNRLGVAEDFICRSTVE